MKKYIILSIILATSIFIPNHVSAQSGDTVGLSISPAIVEIAGDPGSKHKAQVSVRNTSAKPLPISIEVTSLIPVEDEIDRSRRAEFDASSWVIISMKDILLAPGESKLINADVAIPKEANPGGHYAQIGFRVLSQANYNPKTNAQIIPEVAASLFITVAGDVNEKAEFNTDDFVSSYINRGSEAKFSFFIRNTGNVHILPSPKVTIFHDSGKVAELNLQPQLVLPNTQKQFTVDWPADVSFGSYSARAETVYGTQSIPLVSDVSEFRVGPAWWQILILLTAVSSLFYLLFRRRHLPNFFKTLAGKRIHSAGKNRYSRPDNDANDKKLITSAETVDEYASIADFLGESKPVQPIAESQIIEHSKQLLTVPKPVKAAEVIGEAMQKTVDTPIKSIPITPKVTITEVSNRDDESKKTVIVQTSASTIIRQESKIDVPVEPTKPKPTIIRVGTPAKQKIHIEIKDVSTPPPKVKPQRTGIIEPATRSEKIATKAALAQKKARKRKV